MSDQESVITKDNIESKKFKFEPLFEHEKPISEVELKQIWDNASEDLEKKPESVLSGSTLPLGDQDDDKLSTRESILKESKEQQQQSKESKEQQQQSKESKEQQQQQSKESKEAFPDKLKSINENLHKALQEQRYLRQEDNRKIDELTAKLNNLSMIVEDRRKSEFQEKQDTFKVLSDEELEQLNEEDPLEFNKYFIKLRSYERKQAVQREVEHRKAVFQQKTMQDITAARQEMARNIPGLYEENSSINNDLTKFMIDNGMDINDIGLLTDPSTIIFIKDRSNGRNTPVPLGMRAASLVNSFYKIMQNISKNNPEKIRKDLEKEITERVTKELLGKIENNQLPSDYKSLGNISTSKNDKIDKSKDINKVYSEIEWKTLPKAERERILSSH